MMIRANIRLQRYSTNDGMVFVPNSQVAHGVARGPIQYYTVVGGTWTHIRHILSLFEVAGRTNVGPTTVDSWIKDIGDTPTGLFSQPHPTPTVVCDAYSTMVQNVRLG